MVDIDTIVKYSKDLKVLYVEDNKDTRDMTLVLLEYFFDSIVTAVDGKDGYTKFTENEIDLVITDINMPNMDGLAMLQKIKDIDPDIPALIFSAYSDLEHFVHAIKLSVDGYLIKPIDIEQFQQNLYKCIHNIQLQKENKEYQMQLENKVAQQIEILRHKDRLLLEQSKHAAMGEMIDIIAHQWKQPLNSIVMHASLIESSLDSTQEDELKEKVLECYNNLNTQVENLLTTLDEFRNFFRPNNDLNTISLRDIINSTSILLKDELINNQIELNIRCQENLHLKVQPNDIKQLLINIITNAKEEMIRSNLASNNRRIDIHCYKENEKIILEIKNSGKGIDEKIIKDIFNMNFTTKVQNGGTGIGLYMCALICEKYGATIEAYNNGGAVFKVSF